MDCYSGTTESMSFDVVSQCRPPKAMFNGSQQIFISHKPLLLSRCLLIAAIFLQISALVSQPSSSLTQKRNIFTVTLPRLGPALL